MKYRYQIPDGFVAQVAKMDEFGNGATQVSVATEDGRVYSKVLISGSRYIIAMRGAVDLPFPPETIKKIWQTDEDKSPKERKGWHFWDQWKGGNRATRTSKVQ